MDYGLSVVARWTNSEAQLCFVSDEAPKWPAWTYDSQSLAAELFIL